MIHLDCETKSEANLPQVGAWVYSEHPSTEVICVCWAIDDAPVQRWWPGRDGIFTIPAGLALAIMEGHTLEVYNSGFERGIWVNILTPKHGWIEVPDDSWRDLMAVCNYYNLPPGLDRVAKTVGLEGKNPEGERLITMYSKLHLKTAKRHIPDHEWVPWVEMTATERKKYTEAKEDGGYFNEDFTKFVDYCCHDVDQQRDVSNFLGDLPDRELPVFLLDQKINVRGIPLDTHGIDVASGLVTRRADELVSEFKDITGLSPFQHAKVRQWFEDNGLVLENMQAETLEELRDDNDLEPEVQRAIAIRVAVNKASTKKLDAMSRQAGLDSRARFQLRYHGASTGRWTGSGFQPLNLVRGYEGMDPEQLVSDIMLDDLTWLDCIYENAMEAISKAGRYWIKSSGGHRIVAGDYVSIEAVILSCLAGERWKIDAFKDGVKLYELMADKIYGYKPGTVTKATHPMERQDGKTGELAFGYQGAVGAWRNFDKSDRHTDKQITKICAAWRTEHPMIKKWWGQLESAALAAVREGVTMWARDIGFEMVDHWLTMILPSGKRLWYFLPQVEDHRPKWCDGNLNKECKDGTCGHKDQISISYLSVISGKWMREFTYGGKLAENACQAVSREVLVPAMLRVEAAGYPIIMNVYDEIVCEVPDDHGTVEEFADLMARPLPSWADGWPIRVDAWEGARYKK